MKSEKGSGKLANESPGITREKFIFNGLALAASLAMAPKSLLAWNPGISPDSILNNDGLKGKGKKLFFGWTTCLTYETGDRKLGFDYFSNLLDEMHAHDMSHLIVMMASHGYYSPGNHGLAWPVKNAKLSFQLDKKAVNASEETEFFSRIIKKAHSLNIKVYIEIKYLGMIGVEEGYPGIDFKRNKEGQLYANVQSEATDYERKAIETLNICPDNNQAQQYMRDKIYDVLMRYADLDGIVLEHPSYSTCYCESTRERIKKDTGKEIDDLSIDEMRNWRAIRVRDILIDLKNVIKSVNPEFEFGFYTGFSPSDGDVERFQLGRGHNPETLKQVGFDFVLPYCEGRHKENEPEEIQKVIGYLSPFDIYLHTTIRRDPPHNYKLPPKGPEYIKSIIEWGKEYQKVNDRFKGMTFFNEVKLPDENRQAVYDSIL